MPITFPRLPLLGELEDFEAKLVGIRDMRIEGSACPSGHIFMLGMVRITDRVEKGLVSGEAADVLGRASADDVGKARVWIPGFGSAIFFASIR